MWVPLIQEGLHMHCVGFEELMRDVSPAHNACIERYK